MLATTIVADLQACTKVSCMYHFMLHSRHKTEHLISTRVLTCSVQSLRPSVV